MRIHLVASIPLLSSLVSAQITWSSVERRFGHGLAADRATLSLVLFGGKTDQTDLADTWVSDQSGWRLAVFDGGPNARINHAMAYHETGSDPAASSVVMFGGQTRNGLTAETWLWHQDRFVLAKPLAVPRARDAHAMVFVPNRNSVIMFGGEGSSGGLDDTWEWNGTNWVDRKPTNPPPARWGHAMAYDPVRRKVLVFGGSHYLDDTWEYDPVTNAWTLLARIPPAPAGRIHAAMAWDDDAGKIVLYGGVTSNKAGQRETWIWDWNRQGGAGWVLLSPSINPADREQHAMEWDPRAKRVVLLGGIDGDGKAAEGVYEWWRGEWARRNPPPPARSQTAMVYDSARNQVVLFGGWNGGNNGKHYQDTWIWAGGRWQEKDRAISPTYPLRGPAAACDVAHGRVVLFGGAPDANNVFSSDTWLWDGNNWAKAAGSGPAARGNARAVYDAARGRVVLWGGQARDSSNQYYYPNDTWEWDGSQWHDVTPTAPAPMPAGRTAYGLAYDPIRKRVVLFGGAGQGSTWFADTWEWDGVAWRDVTPKDVNPSPREGTMLDFDAARGCVVLFGGELGGSTFQITNQTWEWNGTSWKQGSPLDSPIPRRLGAMCYVPGDDLMLLYGGEDQSRYTMSETWLLRSESPALYRSIGAGCTGTAGVLGQLSVAVGQRPWLGKTMRVDVTGSASTPAAAMLVGFATWQLPVAFLGKDCVIYLDPVVINVVGLTAGMGSWGPVPIPNDSAFLGAAFYNQAIVVSSTYGLGLSGGYEARIGQLTVK